ncbi:hypothetical protein F3Y22_tig00110889pilonHSYRG00141 [Hibiscus syriacus]|uniref:Uncharacterized protein n=1 Tax=Hibiscus syriacus TaxID=106335 RepID=A0A6A2ZHV1_HIBSY|nr:hypothetical protein F3Y22_tig00110889pilonHSYRG00141 [Hibiscus syriacus]
MGQDNEMVELLWENGQTTDHHQTTSNPNQLNLSSSTVPEFRGIPMPPPKFQFDSAQDKKIYKDQANGFGTTATGFSVETSKDDARKAALQSEKEKIETVEPTFTSLGGSGFTSSHKRKSIDGEDYECQSEAAEHQSAAANKPPQRSGLSRRSRAAEVHYPRGDGGIGSTRDASMKELLIATSHSVTASVNVDGKWDAPMMFPGSTLYVPHGKGNRSTAIPSIHSPLQTATGQTQQLNPINYQHQVQNPTLSDQYALFLGFHHSIMPLRLTTTTNNTSPSGR